MGERTSWGIAGTDEERLNVRRGGLWLRGRIEPAHEMQRAIEQQARGPRIKMQRIIPVPRREPHALEFLSPLRAPPVVVRKSHAVARVSDPIHKTQGGKRQNTLGGVIL